MERRLKEIILSQQGAKGILERQTFRLLEDTLTMEEVTTIVGPRRAGKTSALKWLINKEGGIYINFEDPRLPKSPSFILEVSENFPDGPLALDEIHLVEGWERAVATLMHKRKIFVSGSTAHLLSREYGTFLTGRHITVEVLPLSYQEFISFDGNDFEEYLYLGGYPRIVITKNKKLLAEYFYDVIARDVVFRYRVDASKIEALATHLVAHSSKLFSERRLASIFQLSPNTVGDYIHYLEEAFLLERIMAFHPKLAGRWRLPFKILCVDHGYVSYFLPDKGWKGRALETVVYWELRRRTKNILYHLLPEGDFLIHKAFRPLAVINVAYEIMEENRRREEAISSLRVPFKALVAVRGEGKDLPTYRPWEFSELWEDMINRVFKSAQ